MIGTDVVYLDLSDLQARINALPPGAMEGGGDEEEEMEMEGIGTCSGFSQGLGVN